MKKIISTILLVIYAVVAITVTILLLSYNEYMCSEIGGYTIYTVADDSFNPRYQNGDLLLIKNSKENKVNVGDEILLYKVISNEEYEVVVEKLENKVEQGKDTIYEVENQMQYDSSYLIGKVDDVKVIHNLGTVLSVLESRWGYLFLVVVISLLLLLHELFELFIEIKYGKETTKETKKA